MYGFNCENRSLCLISCPNVFFFREKLIFLGLIYCPAFLSENTRYRYLLIIAMESSLQFNLIDQEYNLKNISHDLVTSEYP
jgi:hypothetical protein